MPRVAGVDPGTVSFDLCVLQDGEPVVEQVFETGSLSDGSALRCSRRSRRHGPYDLIYGPSGYGLPLVAAADVGERELARWCSCGPTSAAPTPGSAGMRSLLRALARSGLPVVFGPGVIHLPSVPRAPQVQPDRPGHRRQGVRGGVRDRRPGGPAWRSRCDETAMVLLELGGAFTAALAVAGGQIVDGVGGSSGPLGVRAAGALDGELAYLLGPALSKRTLFTGGALDPARRRSRPGGVCGTRRRTPRDGRRCWRRRPRRSGRWPSACRRRARSSSPVASRGSPELVAALAASLDDVAPVIAPRARRGERGGARRRAAGRCAGGRATRALWPMCCGCASAAGRRSTISAWPAPRRSRLG